MDGNVFNIKQDKQDFQNLVQTSVPPTTSINLWVVLNLVGENDVTEMANGNEMDDQILSGEV